ncbi:MAG: cytochrome C [Clostridiales bacterium]|nr:cytochrome C [Clostridiales bacterium]
MKKFVLILAAVLTMSMFTACGNKDTAKEEIGTEEVAVEETKEEIKEETVDTNDEAAVDTTDEVTVGVYTIHNTTGELVSELYVYETGAEEKGENLAGEGLNDTEKVEATYEGTTDTVLTLEFTTESGFQGTFETLYIEEVNINLLAADAMTGATPIQFIAE